jgi:ABC-type transport system substrate-binding protein
VYSSLLRAFMTGGLTAALLTGATACKSSPPPPPPTATTTPTATISTPSNQGTVEHTAVVKGTVTGVPEGQLLWAVVQPLNAPTYHPQSGAFTPDAKGSWSVICYFGEEKQTGSQSFNLLIIAVDPPANTAMKAYLDGANKKHSYPGMDTLPPGATTLTNITVTRP